MSYACKWCDYVTSDLNPGANTNELFNILNAHQAAEHPDEKKATMRGPRGKKNIKPKSERRRKVEEDEVSPSETQREGDVKVRLTNEQISLPGELFVLYTWIKTQFPDYTATKSDWLQHVVATWAIEHAEEINLPAIPGVFIGNALDLEVSEESEDEDGEDDTEEQSVPMADWDQFSEESGEYESIFGR